jgi:hypothetical protein
MFKNIIVLIFLLINSFALAADTSRLEIQIVDSHGESANISLQPKTNSQGELEVKIEAAGLPKIMNHMNPIIGYGRDLLGSGKINTWFILTESGLKVVQNEGNDQYGRDIIAEILFDHYKSTSTLYLSSISTTLLSYFFLSIDAYEKNNENFYKDWINLEDMYLRLETEKNNPASSLTLIQIEFQNKLILNGYKQLNEKMKNFEQKDLYGYLTIDVASWVTGGILLKWGARIISTPLRLISETSFFKLICEKTFSIFEKYRLQLSQKFKIRSKYFNESKFVSQELGARFILLNWKKDVDSTIRGYVIKNKLIQTANKIFTGAVGQWKYIGLNMGIQLSSEAYARVDEIQNPNPVVMAKNLLSNQDVLQNIGFMALDTVLMTGISSTLKTTKARFMACGYIALQNSSLINFVIKKDDNYSRIALDTSWEVIIGNAQTQIDLGALLFFEQMAMKKNNPKIKLLGYAFVVVDQAIGYVSYSKVTSKLNQEKSPILVPIFSESPM